MQRSSPHRSYTAQNYIGLFIAVTAAAAAAAFEYP
jgi:hypothetical protein